MNNKMETKTKLTNGQLHFLRLIAKGQNNPEGWSPVSKPVYPLVRAIPPELVELQAVGDEGRGRARLMPVGEILLGMWINQS